ncbi:MAG: 23S rRNA (guanosine(2251)-2'-O)-methyltransferase RlmB [Actinobacteria bacterium]|jgi:23S rRNA (guanosine2251-2'-O)-methyltransferase|nr:23S rRNA (guanosine(2251)-2'-O)-methyltransferase RlmB [Acidimicrobiia bacterium]MCX6505162.1 23S rRNA (guanosine(2251)-2'-O)-methyltransferase RlmB [Actinomycetota bacterium]GDX30297.1 23S rRNA (guanosine(2251)-2'-O)-methyltransferase RlmB [Actinomycetes bacterium]MSO17269.1 23S rRNA (guanosine(2251)-2'-O)-methyltransferase RlmB [Acidimicrobiia bacterium]MSW61933.1 23S rRNA (guanosine(2251)-2'-O)-methyltransferase RlmB [Actinomycetota bacterium]
MSAARRTTSGLGGEIVPGRQAVRELLIAKRRKVHGVMIARDANDRGDEILELARAAGIEVQMVKREDVAREARIETHQGIVARAEAVADVPLDQITSPQAFLVALDGVTDPRNLGAVLRTAEVAGATGAILARHGGATLSPAAIKSAAGAVEHLSISLVSGIAGALENLRRANIWSVGLDHEGPTSIYDLTVATGPVVLVLGAEGAGLARLTRERCDILAAIPTHGSIESLNVSAAAAIACFELARRRSADNLKSTPG